MNVPSYAAAAAKLLERGLRQRSAPPDEDRARGVATIERALQARARRHRFRTAFGVAAAAALAVLGWQGFHAAADDADSRLNGCRSVVHASRAKLLIDPLFRGQ